MLTLVHLLMPQLALSQPPCIGRNYDMLEIVAPNGSTVLQAGQKFNISYSTGTNITYVAAPFETSVIYLSPYDRGDLNDPPQLSVPVPDVGLTYDHFEQDEDGSYIASWSSLDECGNSAYNFTWIVPTNLTTIWGNSTAGVEVYMEAENAGRVPGIAGAAAYKTRPFAIEPPVASHTDTNRGQKDRKGMPESAKARIAVAVVLYAAITSLIAWLLWMKHIVRLQPVAMSEISDGEWRLERLDSGPVEADGRSVRTIPELDPKAVILEADGQPHRVEMRNRQWIS